MDSLAYVTLSQLWLHNCNRW